MTLRERLYLAFLVFLRDINLEYEFYIQKTKSFRQFPLFKLHSKKLFFIYTQKTCLKNLYYSIWFFTSQWLQIHIIKMKISKKTLKNYYLKNVSLSIDFFRFSKCYIKIVHIKIFQSYFNILQNFTFLAWLRLAQWGLAWLLAILNVKHKNQPGARQANPAKLSHIKPAKAILGPLDQVCFVRVKL